MRKAYVMIEAMIGGALLAVALASAMSLMAFYRRETTASARKAVASAIALGITNELVTRPFGSGSASVAAYPGYPGFSTQWSVTQDGVHLLSVPALTNIDELHLITVTVYFQTSDGTSSLTYQRYKRQPA
jgi:hypothetical protein